MAKADGRISVQGSDSSQPAPLCAEESGRANLYALCASLLLHRPDGTLLRYLSEAAPPNIAALGNPLHDALGKLSAAAGITPPDVIGEEFTSLFISTGTPVINPYASVYLTGFMHDQPLTRLRGDLTQLGLARVGGRGEAEDHLGVLCEVMRVLIASCDLRQPLSRQQAFFFCHIHPWHALCLSQIRRTAGATFYGCVAEFIDTFLSIEAQAFSIDQPARQAREAV